jgi:hypothetical protein
MGHGSKLRRGFVEDGTPELTKEQSFARITELRGKGIVAVTLPGETELTPALAYLPPKFRGVLYLRRGAFVVVSPLDGGDSIQKVNWSIETLLRNEDIKQYRKEGIWYLKMSLPFITL